MFYNNLLRLCAERNITPTTVARDLQLSTGSPTAWKRGSIPRGGTLQRIAQYFNVTIDELTEELDDPDSPLHRERGVRVPVTASVGAGIPQEMIYTFDQNDPDAWEDIALKDAKKGTHFALRVRGNSMSPLIKHGDVVIVRITGDLYDGDIIVACAGHESNEGLIKRLEYRDNGITLLSDNPEYPPIYVSQEEIDNGDVRLIGQCIEIRHRLVRQ